MEGKRIREPIKRKEVYTLFRDGSDACVIPKSKRKWSENLTSNQVHYSKISWRLWRKPPKKFLLPSFSPAIWRRVQHTLRFSICCRSNPICIRNVVISYTGTHEERRGKFNMKHNEADATDQNQTRRKPTSSPRREPPDTIGLPVRWRAHVERKESGIHFSNLFMYYIQGGDTMFLS